jgi:hypothetical protein
MELYNCQKTTSTTNMEYMMVNSGTSEVWLDTGTPSDIRLKEIIKPLTEASAKFSTLQTNLFTYNDFCIKEVANADPDEVHIGLIAQDLEKVFPQAVKEFEGNDGNKYKRIEYERLVPALVTAVNEKTSEINELKSIVQKQQEQIDKLLELNNLK